MSDDIDEFIEKGAALNNAKYKKYRGRREREAALYREWVAGGKRLEDPRLEELLKSMDPIIQREAKRRVAGLGGRIPIHTLKNELRNHAVTALHQYDPSRSTQLSTFVHQNFQRVTDFVAKNRNTKRMTKDKVNRYQEFQNAKALFREEFGRDPTVAELQSMFPKWPKKTIQDMERGFVSEVYSGVSHLEGDHAEEDDLRGAFLMAKALMTPEERAFGEKYFPPMGKRRPSISAIAKAMGIPEHKAYRIKKKVELKLQPIVKRQ